MGIAAYNRGSRAISDYITQQSQARRYKPVVIIKPLSRFRQVTVTTLDGFTKQTYRWVGRSRMRDLIQSIRHGGLWLESITREQF